MTTDVCTWTIDIWDDSTMYETSCGHTFQLLDPQKLSEHGFRFCVYCGNPLTEVRLDRYAEDDE